MDVFRWNQYYVTGLQEVDDQHMRLVALINRLGNIVTNGEGSDTGAISNVLTELVDYADYHFTEEERLGREAQLDSRHRCAHKSEHQSFTNEVARLTPDTMSADGLNHLLKYLVNWLAYHILGSDQSMARQIAMIRKGETAAKAYEIDDRLGISVTEPLVAALNGLFQQVSERNLQLLHLNQTLETKVEERTRELALANRHLEELSLTDMLTGLPNPYLAAHPGISG
jgi:hemerythrin-like metal-binding protein